MVSVPTEVRETQEQNSPRQLQSRRALSNSVRKFIRQGFASLVCGSKSPDGRVVRMQTQVNTHKTLK